MPANLESLHRFHSYCARFSSEVVEQIITEHTREDDNVFDPFCGSGTALVAALANKRKAIGMDIDILAGMLSEIKCEPRSHSDYSRWRQGFVLEIDRIFETIAKNIHLITTANLEPGMSWLVGDLKLHVPTLPKVNYWFPPELIAVLAAIADLAHRQDPHFEKVVLISLSASIIAKWPNTLSYAMDIDHTRPHRREQNLTLSQVRELFLKRLDRTLTCLSGLYDAYKAVGVSNKLKDYSWVIYPHDARQPSGLMPDESQDLVMTSPPYFNAVDYPRSHMLSVCWMNGHAPEELSSRRSYVGLHSSLDFDAVSWFQSHKAIYEHLPELLLHDKGLIRRLGSFFSDLENALIQTWRVLKPGGWAVFIIGSNVIKGERIESHRALANLAKVIGFNGIEVSPREIASPRRRFPVGPFGFNGPMKHEYIVRMQKSRLSSG